MKLDPIVMELTALIEKHKGQDTYTFIPQIIREEVHDIVVTPVYVRNKSGEITSISFTVKVGYNKNEKAA